LWLQVLLAPYVTNYEVVEGTGKKKKLPKGREFRAMICGLQSAGKTTLVMQCEKQCEITWAASLTPLEGEMTMHIHGKNHLILWDSAIHYTFVSQRLYLPVAYHCHSSADCLNVRTARWWEYSGGIGRCARPVGPASGRPGLLHCDLCGRFHKTVGLGYGG
jgi:hypothetical protein